MDSIIERILLSVRHNISNGYYSVNSDEIPSKISLKKQIAFCKTNPVIAEMKFSSPSHGVLRENDDSLRIIEQFEIGGAVGVSILTEKDHFNGSIERFKKIKNKTNLPLLMKDFIISPVQIDAARNIGASAVLLISSLFNNDQCEFNIDEMLNYVHSNGLEALLEVHDENEYELALQTKADLIGINNRDLSNMTVDLSTTGRIISSHTNTNKIIVSESGIENSSHIRLLRDSGAQAFLVGASIMRSSDIVSKIKELVEV